MIHFYQVTESYNTIGKTDNRDVLFTINVPLKKDTDILKPELLLYTIEPLEVMNYCYISDFRRYYFIEDIEQARENLYRVKCKVDVLESYKVQILNSKDIDFNNSVEVLQTNINATETNPLKVSYVLSTIGG